MDNSAHRPHQVVIIGGGFGGLTAAQQLADSSVQVTLVDKRNFHLFQPLLYQVASGSLSPSDIASPFREVLHRQRNVDILLGEAVDLDPESQTVFLRDGSLHYDSLIVATGGTHQYFGHDEWQKTAPGLKTMEDALEIRRRILSAFESAEKENDPEARNAWMTFVIVGGGPTGVEMAGTLAELSRRTLKSEFHHIDTSQVRILLVEASDQILGHYPQDLVGKAVQRLQKLGVTIRTGQTVKAMDETHVEVSVSDQNKKGQTEALAARTLLWTAGVKASGLGKMLSEHAGAALDKNGQVKVSPNLSIPGHENIFVIGDLAGVIQDTHPLPGLASVAMQEGRYVAKLIRSRLAGNNLPAFQYRDKGTLSVIGRNYAIADLGKVHLSGFSAWLIWMFVHIFYLIGFENKVLVLWQWFWNAVTLNRSDCLITE